MKWFSFKIKKSGRRFLGIDIGTSAIRAVELECKGDKLKLENYGEIKISSLQKFPFRIREKNNLLLSNQEIAKAISAILKAAGIQSREVNFSIPDFATFVTSFKLPSMSERELAQAIKYEARSYIPLPLSHVTLDWLIIGGEAKEGSNVPLEILVVAIPNEVVEQYREIAALTGLEMKFLESEVFPLSRSLIRSSNNEEKTVAIFDIGAESTTVNLLEKGLLKDSHSLNISGNELTEVLSRSLKIDYDTAEQFKKEKGLIVVDDSGKNIREILIPILSLILNETRRIFKNFYEEKGKEVEKIILAGETSLLPGLREYFAKELQKETEIANPFSQIIYPQILEPVLREISPAYPIAVGLAMKGFE